MSQCSGRPWKIGDFFIRNKTLENHFSYGMHFIFDGRLELLEFLNMLRNSFGPMGKRWNVTKNEKSPKPYLSVVIWFMDDDDYIIHVIMSYSTRSRLAVANKLFSKHIAIPMVPLDIIGKYFDILGQPYSWHLLSHDYFPVPLFFERNNDAIWTIVHDDIEEKTKIFANDDNTLMMAKLLS